MFIGQEKVFQCRSDKSYYFSPKWQRIFKERQDIKNRFFI